MRILNFSLPLEGKGDREAVDEVEHSLVYLPILFRPHLIRQSSGLPLPGSPLGSRAYAPPQGEGFYQLRMLLYRASASSLVARFSLKAEAEPVATPMKKACSKSSGFSW